MTDNNNDERPTLDGPEFDVINRTRIGLEPEDRSLMARLRARKTLIWPMIIAGFVIFLLAAALITRLVSYGMR